MKPIVSETSVEAWLTAAEHLHAQDGWQDRRLILEIKKPLAMPPRDRNVHGLLDQFLRQNGAQPISTVAGTIFPLGLYQRLGREGLYQEYREIYPKIQRDSNARPWGTYFYRMIDRVGSNGTHLNPLDYLVEKLRKGLSNPAAYELDLDDSFSLPIYDATRDKHHPIGGPCLSHLSISRTPLGSLDITVLYRKHFYVERTLGNLIGLGYLLGFLSRETGLRPGVLLCVSNVAQLETKRGRWGKKDLSLLLSTCRAASLEAAA
jgi:hypothetical protein